MITVTVERGPVNTARARDLRSLAKRGAILKVRVEGHAGFAKRGADIVCAAASATIYTAAGALCELCGAPGTCMTEREGYFELIAPRFDDLSAARDAEVVMETAYIGYRQIEASYPAFLRVTETGGSETERND